MSRKQVSLSDYLSDWEECFDEVKMEIQKGIPYEDLDLHHIGSTSIPKIKAKPIIDILGVVKNIDEADRLKSSFEALGFVYKGEYGIEGRRYCVLYDKTQEKGLVHLHIFGRGHSEVERHLLFRDYLRENKDAADRYDRLKVKLVTLYSTMREKYTNSKSNLIQEILDEAMKKR